MQDKAPKGASQAKLRRNGTHVVPGIVRKGTQNTFNMFLPLPRSARIPPKVQQHSSDKLRPKCSGPGLLGKWCLQSSCEL